MFCRMGMSKVWWKLVHILSLNVITIIISPLHRASFIHIFSTVNLKNKRYFKRNDSFKVHPIIKPTLYICSMKISFAKLLSTNLLEPLTIHICKLMICYFLEFRKILISLFKKWIHPIVYFRVRYMYIHVY